MSLFRISSNKQVAVVLGVTAEVEADALVVRVEVAVLEVVAREVPVAVAEEVER